MKIEVALNAYFFATSLMKDCQTSGEGSGKCEHCNKIDAVIHKIFPIEEDILKALASFLPQEEGFISLDDKLFKNDKKKYAEIKKRLRFLKERHGAEEMPGEFSSLFEDLDGAIKVHPHLD